MLADGEERVCTVGKYLTRSPWSHTARYIGSARLRDPRRRAEIRGRFGAEARYLVLEALVAEGVVVAPLVKYIDFNIRVCRPHGLPREQIEEVLRYALSRLGYTYDKRNILDLLRYLLPVQLIPNRPRAAALPS